MNFMDYNCQYLKILNDGHLKFFGAACTGWGAGNNPEPFGVAFQHIGPTFIKAYACIVNLFTNQVDWDWGQYGAITCRRDGLCQS